VPIAVEQPSREVLAHRKVDAGLAALARYPDQPWYVLCDADLLFRRSLATLTAQLARYDAAVVMRDGMWEGRYYEHLRVACGFVGYRDDRVLRAWRHAMQRPTCRGYDRGTWFYDQITLVDTVEQLSLNYLALDPAMYVNREFADDAIVWSANMDPKELMYLRFLEELARIHPQ
jgi:hypothetical protein